MSTLQRYAACVEYRGSSYHGWQKQSHATSIQGEIESAVSRIANESVHTTAAGRTDTGVHGIGQVFHFDTHNRRPGHCWIRGVNTYLPDDIVIRWIQPVSQDFHARYGAKLRSYRYIILNRNTRPGYLHKLVSWYREPLDIQPMAQAIPYLRGEHDFSAFRAGACQNKNPVKTISHLSLETSGSWLWLDITADGFLYHMVRNIVGTLIKIGNGSEKPEWLQSVLASRDRTVAGLTAPADGLYFWKVEYDSVFNLPDPPEVCQFW